MRPPGGLVVRTPAAYRIEVLQRVAKREEVPVTVHAGLGGKRARLRSDRQLRFHGLRVWKRLRCGCAEEPRAHPERTCRRRGVTGVGAMLIDRKSTRLNSSHSQISYAVFCLKKKIR